MISDKLQRACVQPPTSFQYNCHHGRHGHRGRHIRHVQYIMVVEKSDSCWNSFTWKWEY